VSDSGTGKEQFTLEGHDSRITSAIFSSDGQRIATSSDDGTVRLWDTEDGWQIALFEEDRQFVCVHEVVFSPNGQQIASTDSESNIRIWSRRRPEYWWGIAWLPEFWIALLSGGALVVIAARRLRARKAVKQETA